MKFMIVSDTFPPDINGVARTLQTLARGLASRGHEVSIVTTTEGAEGEKLRHGVDVSSVHSLPVPGYHGIRLGLASRRFFRRKIGEFKPDGIYVAVETLMGCNAIQAARQCAKRVVSGFHTNFHSYSDDYRLPFFKKAAMWYLQWIHNRTARTLTPSQSTAEQLRALGIRNVGVLGRGVDTELFLPGKRDLELRRTWGADDQTPVALFVGRIAAEKNLPLAVKAFQRVQELHPGAKAVFVGGGPKANWLKEKYPDFLHEGPRTGEELARYYASADLFIFPSLTETFGNVLPEALASGLVTVSYDYAAARQIVRHGVNGFVAPEKDEDAYLDCVAQALGRWNDSGLRTAARATALKLSWSAVVEQFESELLGGPASTVPEAVVH